MIYLFESELPENKSIFFVLCYIYGIGKKNSFFICKIQGFSKNLKIENLSKDQLNKLILTIESFNLNLGTDLKKLKLLSLKKLISIKSFRGFRRNQGLPTRGQRTHTNAQTARKKLKNLKCLIQAFFIKTLEKIIKCFILYYLKNSSSI